MTDLKLVASLLRTIADALDASVSPTPSIFTFTFSRIDTVARQLVYTASFTGGATDALHQLNVSVGGVAQPVQDITNGQEFIFNEGDQISAFCVDRKPDGTVIGQTNTLDFKADSGLSVDVPSTFGLTFSRVAP